MTAEKLVIPIYDYNKWRLIIPKQVREKLEIKSGDIVEVVIKKWDNRTIK